MNNNTLLTYGITALVVLLIWFTLRLITRGTITLKGLVAGKDGGLSTSQFQALLWTFLVFAAYIVVYTANALKGNFSPLIDIPGNLLAISGLSFATYVGADKVTGSKLEEKVGSARSGEAKATTQQGTLRDLFNDDSGKGDLGKLQLMMWSLLAAALFVIQFHNRVVEMPPTMLHIPDIDPSLLAIVGLGQSAYLVKKAIVDDPKPRADVQAEADAAKLAMAAAASPTSHTAVAIVAETTGTPTTPAAPTAPQSSSVTVVEVTSESTPTEPPQGGALGAQLERGR